MSVHLLKNSNDYIESDKIRITEIAKHFFHQTTPLLNPDATEIGLM